MANAIKKISVQRGHDVTRYTLCCFGGAGGQHACLVADALGMTRVFIHPLAGVLSAYGMGLADQIAMREAAVELPLDDAALPRLRERAGRSSARDARERARARRAWRRRASRVARRVHLRYEGTDTALVVPFGTLADDARRVRGGLPPALRLPDARPAAGGRGGVGRGGRPRASAARSRPHRRAPGATRRAPSTGAHVSPAARWHDAGADRARDARARRTRSTARRSSPRRTRRPWSSRAGRRDVTPLDHLVLERAQPRAGAHAPSAPRVDPVMLEVFNNLFMSSPSRWACGCRTPRTR